MLHQYVPDLSDFGGNVSENTHVTGILLRSSFQFFMIKQISDMNIITLIDFEIYESENCQYDLKSGIGRKNDAKKFRNGQFTVESK